ncbi:MAG: hypothetical protein HYW57_01220 [Ignavibacteriales bacterium]|nr:hypothetical protein [Ignavibacteriales bacterium]
MKRRKLRAYLSGGMEYAQDEGADWRSDIDQWIRKTLGHTVFNPNTESAKYLSKRIPNENFRKLKVDNPGRFTSLVTGIVDLDSREIARKTDYVICYWDRSAQRGAGTKGELTIARLFRKPVYMVTEVKTDNIPGWVLGCTTRIFPSFVKLRQFLERKYRKRSSVRP